LAGWAKSARPIISGKTHPLAGGPQCRDPRAFATSAAAAWGRIVSFFLNRTPRRLPRARRDCRGVRLAEFFLPPPRTSLAWSIRPIDMWTLQHGSFFTLLIGTELRPSHGPSRDLRWAIKAKAAAPPRLTTHSRLSRPPPSSHPPAPTSVAQAP
jgi:hypothetical protein